MNPLDLNEFRHLLELELARLNETARQHLEELNHLQESDLTDHEYQATDLGNAEVGLRIAGSEVALVQTIRKALQRIEAGGYGVCEGCGGEIPVERLRARPSATLCVPCQEAAERR